MGDGEQRAAHRRGDIIEVQVCGDSLLLTPKRLVDKSEACFWSPGWQEAEHRASEDIAVGRLPEFEGIEHLLEHRSSGVTVHNGLPSPTRSGVDSVDGVDDLDGVDGLDYGVV